MKTLSIIAAIGVLALPVAASAMCVGSDTFESCTDDSGNSYTVNRLGGMTQIQGYNSNNGHTWSETEQNLGGGYHSYSGVNAQGQYYSGTCSQYGCN